jgi:glutaredoxin
MGRITIFVTDANSACTRTIAAFKARKIPLSIINLTKHPHKRDDMTSLCMLNSTPQVFFNTRYIGGAEESLELLEEWAMTCKPDLGNGSTHGASSVSSHWSGGSLTGSKDSRRGSTASKQSTSKKSTRSMHTYGSSYDRYMAEIGNFHDPIDKRLALPDKPPILDEPSLPRNPKSEFCISIPGDHSTVLEMTQMFVDLIQHEDNTVCSVTYKKSFFGSNVIKILIGAFEIQEKEAFKLASQLLSLGIFLSLNGPSGISFDIESLYRLQCYHTPGVLNSYRVWTENVDSDGLRLANNLIRMLNEIEAESTDMQGILLMNEAVKMPEYSEFEEAICELQGVNISRMNHMTKLVCLLTRSF